MTTPETPTSSAEPQIRVRARRRGGSPLDMVRSLALVGLAVLGMVAFTFFGQPEHPPVTVDVSATVQAARTDAGFPVLALTSLPTDWYANFADFSPVSGSSGEWSVHVGYVTDDEAFFAVDGLATTAAKRMESLPVRKATVAGLEFSIYEEAGTTTAVYDASASSGYVLTLTGSGSAHQWKQFLAALSPDGAIAS